MRDKTNEIPDVFHPDATVRIACVEGSFNLCDPESVQYRLSVVVRRGAQSLVVSECFNERPDISDYPSEAAELIREKVNKAWINTARESVNADCDAIARHADLVDRAYLDGRIEQAKRELDRLNELLDSINDRSNR